MKREAQLAIYLSILNLLTKDPIEPSIIGEKLNLTKFNLRYYTKKLKAAGLLGTTYNGLYASRDHYDIKSISIALGFKAKKIKPWKCDICSEWKSPKLQGWDNHTCPDCVALGSLLDDPNMVSNKPCQACGKPLTKDRYYKCYDCQPRLSSINEDYMYEDIDNQHIDEDFYEVLADTQFHMANNNGRVGHAEKKKIKEILGEQYGYDQSETVTSESDSADEGVSD